MSGTPKAPTTGTNAFDGAIGRATTLGQLEALAGLTPDMRIGFWLQFAGIEPEGDRLAAGIAELKQRIRRTGLMA